jgi:hypothetical protein
MPAFVLHRKHALSLAVALVLTLTGAVSAQTGPIKGNLHVVAFGVGNAQGQPFVYGPAENAEAQTRFWSAQGGKVYNRVYAAAPLTNESATRKAILDRLDRLIETAQAGDTAVVYVCAHGGANGTGPQKDLYAFAAYDGDVHAGEFRQRIEALAHKGVHVLLILETCHAGAFEVQGDNIIVLGACTAEEVTPAAQRSGQCAVFTEVLLEGLKGAADGNHDGVITLAELNAYVAQRRPCTTCTQPANIRSNLALAAVGASARGPDSDGPTEPVQPQH